MVEQTNTNTPHSDNTAHESETGTVDKSIIGKIWKKSVRTEQQLDLLRRLEKLKLGTKDVEEKFASFVDCMKSNKKQTRDIESIVNTMHRKVVNAEDVWKQADR